MTWVPLVTSGALRVQQCSVEFFIGPLGSEGLSGQNEQSKFCSVGSVS